MLIKNIHLKRYDYNVSACGMDWCDRESAGAKLLIQSYADASHDLVSVEDVADALKYGSEVKNSSFSCEHRKLSSNNGHENSKDKKFSFLWV